jgi:hypothetical protein
MDVLEKRLASWYLSGDILPANFGPKAESPKPHSHLELEEHLVSLLIKSVEQVQVRARTRHPAVSQGAH